MIALGAGFNTMPYIILKEFYKYTESFNYTILYSILKAL